MEQEGFEVRETGDWQEVVTFCERLAAAIKPHVSDDIYQRFERWRPKPDEQKTALRERTAEEAAIDETAIEVESEGAKAEMAKARDDVKHGGKAALQGDTRQSVKDVEHAGGSAARGIIPLFIRGFRILEELLYSSVLERTNPSYFECALFTIGIERDMLDRNQYTVRITFDDDTLQDTVVDELDTDEATA